MAPGHPGNGRMVEAPEKRTGIIVICAILFCGAGLNYCPEKRKLNVSASRKKLAFSFPRNRL